MGRRLGSPALPKTAVLRLHRSKLALDLARDGLTRQGEAGVECIANDLNREVPA
jgi:hypothetical protein